MLRHIPFPVLPAPPSWYPGHMTQFTRQLPQILRRTDVVLEIRDARLPLTSINRNFEGALRQWQIERRGPHLQLGTEDESPASGSRSYLPVCERIVVFNKRDLVPEWGIDPFRKAMSVKYPGQTTFMASTHRLKDIKRLSKTLIEIANRNPAATELNVLVVGMPNVGKSTFLNSLREVGYDKDAKKAFRTSSQPGLTRALSNRVKLSEEPLIYSYDTPGVMLPFLGKGDSGAERGAKLALIAGIREGLYDVDALASYLLYRLNILDPISPAYLSLVPPGTPPTTDTEEFLQILARRLGALRKGGIAETDRAARWFIQWWRDTGARIASSTPRIPTFPPDVELPESYRRGWGFDFEWSIGQADFGRINDELIQVKMEECIEQYERGTDAEEREGSSVSATQQKKREREELLAKRAERARGKLASRSRGSRL